MIPNCTVPIRGQVLSEYADLFLYFLIDYMIDVRQHITPQPGFQSKFLASAADIVVGGGAAGAGKSFALLMEVLRHAHVPGFRAAVFRRTTPQIKNAGGLWDTSKELYGKIRDGAGKAPVSTEQPPKWTFPGGATLLFSHLEHEADKYAWDGAQIALLGFDELIHFTESQFWYMVGRNRSTCGVRPYVRATTNPQSYGWVKRLISWWIYPDDYENEALRGMPIPERVGVMRWLVRNGEKSYWGETAAAAIAALPEDVRDEYTPELVKSVTFVPGVLTDNRELTSRDPAYKGNLLAQDKEHGQRLLRGCWYDAAGENDLFQRGALEDMFGNEFVDGGAEWYLSADVAMEGSDCFRVGVWHGLRLERIVSLPKSNGREVWETMQRLAAEHRVPGRNIVFDANGVGNFLTGFFRSAFDFRSQSAPLPVRGDVGAVKVDYENLRTQCAYKLAELVAKNAVFVRADGRERDAMIEEFEAHKKLGTNPGGKLIITRKQEIKAGLRRSPDYFDMVMMRMVFEIAPRRRSYLLEEGAEVLTY